MIIRFADEEAAYHHRTADIRVDDDQLERKMRSAAKRVGQSLEFWYLSKMEWFSLRHQHFYAQ